MNNKVFWILSIIVLIITGISVELISRKKTTNDELFQAEQSVADSLFMVKYKELIFESMGSSSITEFTEVYQIQMFADDGTLVSNTYSSIRPTFDLNRCTFIDTSTGQLTETSFNVIVTKMKYDDN